MKRWLNSRRIEIPKHVRGESTSVSKTVKLMVDLDRLAVPDGPSELGKQPTADDPGGKSAGRQYHHQRHGMEQAA